MGVHVRPVGVPTWLRSDLLTPSGRPTAPMYAPLACRRGSAGIYSRPPDAPLRPCTPIGVPTRRCRDLLTPPGRPAAHMLAHWRADAALQGSTHAPRTPRCAYVGPLACRRGAAGIYS